MPDTGFAAGCLQGISSSVRSPLRNEGAIAGMCDDDVVEVSCLVDADGPHPMHIGEIPESQFLLMRDVKRYERLASQAILQHSRKLAAEVKLPGFRPGKAPYNVVLINDDDHSYEYVIRMLKQLFGHPEPKGFLLATEVDTTGRAIVLTTYDDSEDIRRNPKEAMTYCVRAMVYDRMGDKDKAVADFATAKKLVGLT